MGSILVNASRKIGTDDEEEAEEEPSDGCCGSCGARRDDDELRREEAASEGAGEGARAMEDGDTKRRLG